MRYVVHGFSYTRSPGSPVLEVGKEAIRLAVTDLRCEEGRVDVVLQATLMLPDREAERFRDLSSAPCLVVTDVDQQDGFAVRTIDEHFRWPPGEGPPEENLVRLPTLPLPPRGDPSGSSLRGAYIGASLTLETARPAHRPSVFLYLVLENFVSNTVGLDLVDKRAVSY